MAKKKAFWGKEYVIWAMNDTNYSHFLLFPTFPAPLPQTQQNTFFFLILLNKCLYSGLCQVLSTNIYLTYELGTIIILFVF